MVAQHRSGLRVTPPLKFAVAAGLQRTASTLLASTSAANATAARCPTRRNKTPGLPVGEHFQTANVSEFNSKDNPTFTFRFPDPENPGQTKDVTTPDPGLALTTGDVRDVNFFKIPTLWGVSKTAPYFHDNSSATLEELMDHYEDHLATFLFRGFAYPRPHVPTAQDKTDIIAYMRLL